MSQTSLAQGSQSDGGGNGSVTSLKEPVGLQKPSNMLELMGRVVMTVPESSMQKSLHLHPADLAVAEGKWPHLQELQAFGDFSWPFEVGSLEQEGFLAEVESEHFGVEVLELHPEPHWGTALAARVFSLGRLCRCVRSHCAVWGLLGYHGLPDLQVGWGWWHGDLPLECGEVNSLLP